MILSYIILLLIHSIEHLLETLTVVRITVLCNLLGCAPLAIFIVYEVGLRVSITQLIVAAICFVRVAQLVDFFEGLGLLVFQCVQTGLHVQVIILFLCVQSHIGILLLHDLTVEREHRVSSLTCRVQAATQPILEIHLDVLEGEDGLHDLKERNARLNREVDVAVRHGVFE